MADIQAIQEEIITAFQAISLPVLGAPTGNKHEPKNGFNSADLPAVVVNRGIMISSVPLANNRKFITREYITDLFCYRIENDDHVLATERNNTADCIPTILGTFRLYGLDTLGVMSHAITADTGDVYVFSRDDTDNFIGVRFRHTVTYIQLI